ncbi:MOSC domain-containing protein 1, mitochondrial [Heterocephalus glaber]|uniref:MOSC domain-containing protein 1, mitochondrial n=1 Tax=Heterocephalus glaber TaxID=10181 RepID=G5AQS6_HETGA|nr:MOSC domain-containing protein 1, mitochondrial [Heterocephalus glaber]
MVTARQEPRMVLISPTCEDDTLTLSAAYSQDLLLPIKTPTTNPVRTCRVHGLEVQGRDCGEAAAQWITSFLQSKPYRLVHFELQMRPRSSQQIRAAFGPSDQVAYSDSSPFLVLSEASLADLNSRLEKKVTATNFRPNIVISGCGVYEEDTWDELLIGDVRLRRVMACSRCILTTVDPDTGVMHRKEPLEMLRRCILTTVDPDTGVMHRKEPLEMLRRSGRDERSREVDAERRSVAGPVPTVISASAAEEASVHGDTVGMRVGCAAVVTPGPRQVTRQVSGDAPSGWIPPQPLPACDPQNSLSCCSYRQCDPSEQKLYGKLPLFGQYFVLQSPGTVRVGDTVYLLSQ